VLFLTLISIIIIFFSSALLSAHSPTNMKVIFNNTDKVLQVEITHEVSNTKVHYVIFIKIFINGAGELKQEYVDQEGNSFTYAFLKIEAVEGDVIKVTAECNQGGSITKQLTVGSSEITVSEDDDEGSSTPGFELLIFLISLTVIFYILRTRK
jgi:hypothetical protein